MKRAYFKQSAILAMTLSIWQLISPVCSTQAAAQAKDGSATEEGLQSSPVKPTEGKSVFEFDYYADVMDPLTLEAGERLCGLDKACIQLWKRGKLQIFKEGRIFNGDFNQDGKPDEAVILEKDQDEDAIDKDFYILITSKDSQGKRQVLLHELLPDARNVIDTFWDEKKKALVIDTGGRVHRTESIQQIGGAAYVYESAERFYKVIVAVSFNPKSQKFEIVSPVFGKKKKSAVVRPIL